MPLTKTTVAGTPKRACLKPRLRATWCWDFRAARAGTPPTRNFHLELHALLLCRFSPLQVLLSRHCRIRKHRPVRDFSKRAESASPSASPAHARHAPGRPDPNSPRLRAAMALLSCPLLRAQPSRPLPGRRSSRCRPPPPSPPALRLLCCSILVHRPDCRKSQQLLYRSSASNRVKPRLRTSSGPQSTARTSRAEGLQKR